MHTITKKFHYSLGMRFGNVQARFELHYYYYTFCANIFLVSLILT